MKLTHSQIQQFKIDGYLRLPNLLNKSEIKKLRDLTTEHCQKRIPPFELEAVVNYPEAPSSVDAEGGDTIRRLRAAYQRDSEFAKVAEHPDIIQSIQSILQCDNVLLNSNHHNCIMTKQPTYSSKTLWHRDTRYWNFSDKYLINSWVALGDEQLENGAMSILPGSHRWEVENSALNTDQFLKTDIESNRIRLETARLVTLKAGDVLLFSAHCFHAAGKNITDTAKYSMVFTYHGENTKPIAGTPSAASEEIIVSD